MTDHEALSAEQINRIGLPEEEPTFLSHPLHDRLVDAVIALGGELWVERERRKILESLLVSKGAIKAEELRAHALDGDERQTADQELAELVERVLGPLKALRGEASRS